MVDAVVDCLEVLRHSGAHRREVQLDRQWVVDEWWRGLLGQLSADAPVVSLCRRVVTGDGQPPECAITLAGALDEPHLESPTLLTDCIDPSEAIVRLGHSIDVMRSFAHILAHRKVNQALTERLRTGGEDLRRDQ